MIPLETLRADGSPPLLFAHRGVSADAPENTLAAFRLVGERGIPGVELDVHQCATGEVVVSHDADLRRTAAKNLRISRTPLDVLRACDVGSWFAPEFSEERLPLLEEVFDLLGESVIYDIEIKSAGRLIRTQKRDGVEDAVARLIEQHGLEERCFVSSFDPRVLRKFAAVAARSPLTAAIPLALITIDSPKMPWLLRGERARFFHRSGIRKPNHNDVTKTSVGLAHAAGESVIVWTVDGVETARRLASMGVDGIISNCPDVIAAGLEQEGAAT